MKQGVDFIPFDEQLKEFQEYIAPLDRAVFSARFGDGKSTFLRGFQSQYESDYIFFTIYPLHYQVVDNKDVFEYLKRDLLLQLLSYIELSEESYSNILTLYSYITSDPIGIIEEALNIVGDFGLGEMKLKSTISPIINIIKNIKKFKEYKSKLDNATDSKIVENYLTSFDAQNGSIYEFDLITQLICSAIKQVKKENDKQIVLVVEDLDRMDPAHIFRILNVISCHVDRAAQGINELEVAQGENKFMLDKIIMVCDYDNIKSIFHHFYGERTDFAGYISKFSPALPFRYSIKKQYRAFIKSHLDDELNSFAGVTDALASLIIHRMKGEISTEASLREIHCRLSRPYTITDTKIKTRNEELSIQTINPLTKILDVLNRFSIGWRELSDRVEQQKAQEDLYKLIGVCWFIPTKAENYFIVVRNEDVCLRFADHAQINNGRVYFNGSSVVINNSIITNSKIAASALIDPNAEYRTGTHDLLSSIRLIVDKMKLYIINCSI